MSILKKLITSLFKSNKKPAKKPKAEKQPRAPTTSPGLQKFMKHQDFLEKRWLEADRLFEAGNTSSFGEWYYHEPTAAQIGKFKSLGLAQITPQSKGAASDLIGLFSTPDYENKEFLRFYKAYKQGMTETEAREAIRQISMDPDALKRWDTRPPSFEQVVFLNATQRQSTPAKTVVEAAKIIDAACTDNDDEEMKWTIIQEFWADLQDAQTRSDYSLKPITKTIFQDTIIKYFSQISNLEDYDLGEFTELMTSEYPDIARDD